MTLARKPETVAAKLKSLADDFAQIADHASTLAECDRWNADAEQLRLTAWHIEHTVMPADVAHAFIKAAEKRLAAEEEAIHESRASRREVQL